MKKLHFFSLLAIIAVVFASCAEQDQVVAPSSEVETSGTISKIRSVDEAIAIAQNIISGGKMSRSERTLKSRDGATVITNHHSRSEAGDTLIYALDFEDNQGFVLVAAPRNVEPIMAIIDQGSFKDPANLENEQYQFVLSQTMEYVGSFPDPIEIDTMRLPIDTRPWQYYDTLFHLALPNPKVTVAWNQAWPENIYAPNGVAGCTPVAIAQMFSFFEEPTSMTYTFPGADIEYETINWTELKRHVKSENIRYPTDIQINNHLASCGVTYDNHITIGRMIREIGKQCQSIYYTTQNPSTGTIVDLIEGAVYHFINKCPTTYDSMVELYNNFDATNGICLANGGVLESWSWSPGHSWIIDDAIDLSLRITKHTFNHLTNSYDNETWTVEQKYLHHNWGWGGNCNGYFDINIPLQTQNANDYDYSTGNTMSFNPNDFILYYYTRN